MCGGTGCLLNQQRSRAEIPRCFSGNILPITRLFSLHTDYFTLPSTLNSESHWAAPEYHFTVLHELLSHPSSLPLAGAHEKMSCYYFSCLRKIPAAVKLPFAAWSLKPSCESGNISPQATGA